MSWWTRFRSLFARTFPGVAGGDAGERAAAAHLRTAGLTIIARNWRNPRDRREEIDLVCEDDGVLVFVEVKTRATSALVPGYHTVTRKKKAILRRACRAYLNRLHPPPEHHRFDIVDVVTSGHEADDRAGGRVLEVHHYENVPLFEDVR
ncbi:endonuclease [Opitutaceae bacterium TAV4]|nr:endonuclease [Opitutaceae bacterium TAV4]RRJ99451.1 endonuclease [Opitutaceae bacterium TAV3]